MKKDIFPFSDTKLYGFLDVFEKTIGNKGNAYGLSNAQIALAQQLCSEYTAQIKAAQEALAASKSEVTKKNAMRKTHLGPLRKLIRTMKATTGAANAHQLGLGENTQTVKPAVEEYKPIFTADMNSDLIRIRFKKLGIDRVNFYGSCNGAPPIFMGTSSRSPFWFKPELLSGNAPQNWEIKAVGVMNDKEFGQWSPIQPLLYQSGVRQ